MRQLGRRIELLAPAGDRACIQAAIENGADAVYFGLTRGFNARARAENLSLDDLNDVMLQLHARGVKGYVTLNTLVFTDELAGFETIVRHVAAAHVDAVLVQDLGAAQLIRTVCPDLPIHASTQMTLTNAEAVEAVGRLGIQRVVLPRELSVDEIAQIARQTSVELEVFVHGALCVAYSGQCLTSESLGGRSANRGQCAQACRLPYDVIADGRTLVLEDTKFLLSPLDLAAYDLIPQLLRAGVTSLKIEGRLKSAEYVASATRSYRTALDQALSGHDPSLEPEQIEDLSLTFSRGFAPGWLEGCDHKRLVPGHSSAKRGMRVGTVVGQRRDRVNVQVDGEIRPGDGLMFDCGVAQNDQPGGRVYEIWAEDGRRCDVAKAGRYELAFRHGTLDFRQLVPGVTVWKTDAPHVMRRLRQTYEVADPRERLAVNVHVQAVVGRPLEIAARLTDSVMVTVRGQTPLATATRHPVTPEVLAEQLNRLGHTPYELADVTTQIEGQPMVPLSQLGQLRREMIQQLDTMLRRPSDRPMAPVSVLERLRPATATRLPQPTQLTWLCRTLTQLQELLKLGMSEVTVDFADIREYGAAVQAAQAAQADIWLATPRILKPGEHGILRAMLKQQPTGIVARNLSAIDECARQGMRCRADYCLNVANELSAVVVRERGVERLTASYDLNRDQLRALVQQTPPSWLEVVIHQHMPMFHMEHCVFCAVLSSGTNKTNCGRPCDDHVVRLRDRVGMEHLLTADVGCRNTLYNAQPQSAAEAVPELIELGVTTFRVEFLGDEPTDRLRLMVRLYQQLIAGTVSGVDVLAQLNAVNRVGVTRGTLEARRDPLSIL